MILCYPLLLLTSLAWLSAGVPIQANIWNRLEDPFHTKGTAAPFFYAFVYRRRSSLLDVFFPQPTTTTTTTTPAPTTTTTPLPTTTQAQIAPTRRYSHENSYPYFGYGDDLFRKEFKLLYGTKGYDLRDIL